MPPGGQTNARCRRFAALALLLFAAFDLLAVDAALLLPAHPDDCCSVSTQPCFCCCRHVVPPQAVPVPPPAQGDGLILPEPPFPAVLASPVPYHPPRP